MHRLDQAAETRRYDVLHLHGFDENDGHFGRNFFQPDGFRLANVAPRASFRRLAEALPQGVDLVADAQRGGFGLRQEGADFPTGLPAAFPDGVGAENAEGIAVVSANYGFDFFWCHASLFVMECRAGGCGPCNTVARRGARGQGPGARGRIVQTCAFLCAPGAKLLFGRTKPILDKSLGII